MSEASGKWGDLTPRILSAAVLIVLCGIEIYIGGLPFSILVWGVCGLMIWELARMFQARWPVALAGLGALALVLAEKLPLAIGHHAVTLPALAAVVLVGIGQVRRDRLVFAAFLIWVLTGSFAFLILRNTLGLDWFVWLVAVVVVSDILGYFAGRAFGGAKFWPRVSPKKTWSGTMAGWGGAMLIGGIFALWILPGSKSVFQMMVFSALAAFAGQIGDIAESAAKRHVGVKDSSSLIPGHGGVLDRFDAMLGASVFVFGMWAFDMMPGAF